MPDTAKLLTRLIDLALKAQLISEPMEQINTTKACADNQDIGLKVVNVGVGDLGVGLVGISSPDICT